MNQLEELFNEKLANHSVPPPGGGWERIATNLSKKNNTIVWIQWAAVLIIGALAVSIITVRRSEPVEVVSESKEILTPLDQPAKQKQPVAALSQPEKKADKKVYKKRRAEIKTDVLAVSEESAPATDVPKVEAVVAERPVAESKVASRSMVITYTLDPVIEVAPVVEPEIVVAEEQKKGSSLEKVVKFARDVKNGESPIGLRDVKEDLFAQSKKKSPTKTH